VFLASYVVRRGLNDRLPFSTVEQAFETNCIGVFKKVIFKGLAWNYLKLCVFFVLRGSCYVVASFDEKLSCLIVRELGFIRLFCRFESEKWLRILSDL